MAQSSQTWNACLRAPDNWISALCGVKHGQRACQSGKIQRGEVPRLRVDSTYWILWPNQVKRGMPACVLQTTGYQPSAGLSMASVHVSLARYKGGRFLGYGSTVLTGYCSLLHTLDIMSDSYTDCAMDRRLLTLHL